jgi:hypothetical protein
MIFETQDQIRNKTKYFFFQEPELIMRKSSPVRPGVFVVEQVCSVDSSVCFNIIYRLASPP